MTQVLSIPTLDHSNGVPFIAAIICLTVAAFSHAQNLARPENTVALPIRQVLVRSITAHPESLDPALAETGSAIAIVNDLFEGLTALDRDGRVVPGVAHSWKQTSPQVWVFSLRTNARFSNGDPLTAHDFVYSWRRFLDPATASPYAMTFGEFILNGAEIAANRKSPSLLGAVALDAYTLEIRTPGPVPYFSELLAASQFAPLNKRALERAGHDWIKPENFVSNGAYQIKESAVNHKIVLEKNPYYWDSGAVTLNRITYLPVEDSNAAVRLFQAGQVDWVAELPPNSYERLSKAHPEEIHHSLQLSSRYYALNNEDPLLKDVRVRKALSMAIDRDTLANRVTADGQVPLYGLMVHGLMGADMASYDWAKWPMSLRVEEARRLLKEAGVRVGSTVRLSYDSNYHKSMAIFTASEWTTKLGLVVQLENTEQRVLTKKLHDGDYQVARSSWTADYNDATSFLAIVQCNGDQNVTRSCSLKSKSLIAMGSQQTDPSLRKDLLSQAAVAAMEDYPFIPLLQRSQTRLVKTYIGGYSKANVLGRIRSKDLYIRTPVDRPFANTDFGGSAKTGLPGTRNFYAE